MILMAWYDQRFATNGITKRTHARPQSVSEGSTCHAEVDAGTSILTLNLVSSLGDIAKRDDSISWLDKSGDVYEEVFLTTPSTRKSVEFYSGGLEKLVNEILTRDTETPGHVGGAMRCQNFLRLDLVDEIRLSIYARPLRDRLGLFDNSGFEKRWHVRT